MKLTEPVDGGKCPRCRVLLKLNKAEPEINVPVFWQCPACDWIPGDEIGACDMCGEVTDGLVDVVGYEYCKTCADKEATAG